MAFKIKRFIPASPLNIEGVNPGKKLEKNITKKDHPAYSSSGVGSRLVSFEELRSSGDVPKGMEGVFSGKGNLRVSKSYKGRKSSSVTEGSTQGSSSSVKGKSADTRTYDPFSKKTDVKKQKSERDPRNKVEYVKKGKAAEIVIIGNQEGLSEKEVLDSTPEISTKKPTVKVAPKDNSKKAIRKRKKADKAAGVSKSQMRANKAKSKSEAALAKAKKSKNPDYKAQLKRKADRLDARAKRKGGSPVKAVGDPKNPKPRTHAQILKAYPGAVKVPGKINTYKYKGTTLKPALFPVKNKGKTVKQAIENKDK
jgi:hypothetical protein